ncbi:unnamed protein product [Rotaria magnacalcarata]|uniref:Uncharacterized protein n=1 Tax=Rotaria magnacalcarata TaxID=392030 RepID=A0A819D3G5_9BILA|nr:unnamed protein product [Rotaria magnacalcarata]CAF1685142.1 unnamed protein product [Rotaria magnacalcarata]CAF1920231.1 unnamed protein product [Rotaria magnacalcarata]CAF2092373.1 unnamed protein product [Rotaria magnacalcarata]CAF2191693.1 unnamed protein product [Rotaria magnacalcarata]
MNYSKTLSSLDLSNDSQAKPSRPFNINEVKEMLEQITQQVIDRQNEYDCDKCTQLSKDISQIIKDAMKSLNYDRYKYVIQVVIGNCQDENVMMTCRCLWDVETDNYASYVYSNTKIFCAVTVFGLYYF